MRLQPLTCWLFKFAVCAVALGGLAAGATAGTSVRLPKLLADAPHGFYSWQVRPAHIVYTGDGSGVLGGFDGSAAGHAAHPGHLTWSTWTTTRAQGSGAVWIDNCTPDCADGKFTPHAVKVVAFRPVKGHFTRLTLTYTYIHKRYIDKRGISFNTGGFWEYYIVGHLP